LKSSGQWTKHIGEQDIIIQGFKIIGGKEAPQLARLFVLTPNKATRGHRYT